MANEISLWVKYLPEPPPRFQTKFTSMKHLSYKPSMTPEAIRSNLKGYKFINIPGAYPHTLQEAMCFRYSPTNKNIFILV